jgi:alkanesulfonate monooxygenase SsuD/methylene tetrahydromethanopterin reductase-like flavin-dependent oxidoreductase (luciferase family)
MSGRFEVAPLLAHAVATVDRIAEGRLLLGVGIGPDLLGVRHIVLRFGCSDQAAQLERTTREILPRLKG